MITHRQRQMLADPYPYIADAWEKESQEFADACESAVKYIAELENKARHAHGKP